MEIVILSQSFIFIDFCGARNLTQARSLAFASENCNAGAFELPHEALCPCKTYMNDVF